jgi:hypothetical protein
MHFLSLRWSYKEELQRAARSTQIAFEGDKWEFPGNGMTSRLREGFPKIAFKDEREGLNRVHVVFER